jgi:hypothetical protein
LNLKYTTHAIPIIQGQLNRDTEKQNFLNLEYKRNIFIIS